MASLEQFLSVALLTPIFDPTRHSSPSDPTVIWGVPVNLIGLSGIAKTSRIKAVGRAVGIPTHSVFVPTKQPEDFTGAYVPTPDGLVIECVLPAARKCIDTGFGCIHLSELSCGRPAVQAALLSVVNERQVGDTLLPPRTRFLIDMNPTEYAAGGYALEAAMANRMAHKEYEVPPKNQFKNFLLGQVEKLDTLQHGEARVIKNWSVHWAGQVGMMATFLDSCKGEVIMNQPKPDDDHSGGAWPSWRTWHYALCASAAARCLGLQEVEDEFVEALVGKGPAIEWLEHKAKADLPNPMVMLTKGWKPEKKRLDRTVSALISMTEFLKGRAVEDRADAIQLAANAWGLLKLTMDEKLADIVVGPAQVLVRAKLGRHETNAVVAAAAEHVIYELAQNGYTGMAG